MARGGRLYDELSLLKRRGKTVLITFQGCDVRRKGACPCRKPVCFADDRYRPLRAARALRYADRVFYLNPDLRRHLPGAEFLPYANVDPSRVPEAPAPDNETIVILHAPTDTDVKGTRHVAAAVEELRAEGASIELDLLQGVSRDEVLVRCARADIVVDQLEIGWYGGFAVEAMAVGRPVLAFIREEEPEDNPFGDELPIVRTRAEALTEDLRALVADRDRRLERGTAGRRFVEEHHDPREIAARVLDAVPGVRLRSVTNAKVGGNDR